MKKNRGMPLVHANLKDVARTLIRSPDGITTIILSMLFLMMGLFPSVVNHIGRFFHFELVKGSTSYSFLLIPPMMFVSYAWLNAFTRTSQIGAYVNAMMLIVFALLLFFGSVNSL